MRTSVSSSTQSSLSKDKRIVLDLTTEAIILAVPTEVQGTLLFYPNEDYDTEKMHRIISLISRFITFPKDDPAALASKVYRKYLLANNRALADKVLNSSLEIDLRSDKDFATSRLTV